jgi:hypothetical protein
MGILVMYGLLAQMHGFQIAITWVNSACPESYTLVIPDLPTTYRVGGISDPIQALSWLGEVWNPINLSMIHHQAGSNFQLTGRVLKLLPSLLGAGVVAPWKIYVLWYYSSHISEDDTCKAAYKKQEVPCLLVTDWVKFINYKFSWPSAIYLIPLSQEKVNAKSSWGSFRFLQSSRIM